MILMQVCGSGPRLAYYVHDIYVVMYIFTQQQCVCVYNIWSKNAGPGPKPTVCIYMTPIIGLH